MSSLALGLNRTSHTFPSLGASTHPPRLTTLMITAQHLEVRAGARLLMENVSFRVAAGDKVGLVGRNGAGKTTLTKILAGEGCPRPAASSRPARSATSRRTRASATPRCSRASGSSRRAGWTTSYAGSGRPRRRWAARTPTSASARCGGTRGPTPSCTPAVGTPPSPRPPQIAHSLGIEDRILAQPLRTLSGGQRRRVELARILFSGAETLLLDEPTNHLDADSIVWLRDFLKAHRGGLVVISHDTALLEATVNRVLHLDANRAEIDVYNMGWKAYLQQRETDEKRRKRERVNAENKAKTLTDQANKMRAKATKAQAAQSMLKRAEKMLAGLEGERRADRVARIKFPAPARLREDAAHGGRAVEVLRLARGVHRRRPGDRQGLARRDPGPQRRRQDHAAADPRRRRPARHRRGDARPRPQAGLLRPGARDARHLAHRPREHARAPRPSSPTPRPGRCWGRSCSPATTRTSRPRVLSGGEKTRLALAILVVSSANVLLLDEPTNNLDPASREEVLAAIRTYEGAIVLVTHDEGAVHALEPDRVLILPDGVEDLWNADYADLVALA